MNITIRPEGKPVAEQITFEGPVHEKLRVAAAKLNDSSISYVVNRIIDQVLTDEHSDTQPTIVKPRGKRGRHPKTSAAAA